MKIPEIHPIKIASVSSKLPELTFQYTLKENYKRNASALTGKNESVLTYTKTNPSRSRNASNCTA